MRDKDKSAEFQRQTPSFETDNKESAESPSALQKTTKPPEKTSGKLLITGLLGGAITIYVCMFIFKYKRTELLLMVLMPLLGVLNIYLWVLLFRSGFSFFVLR